MASLRRKRSNAILKEPSKDAEKRTSVTALDQRIQQEVMKLTGAGFVLDLATGVANSIDINFLGLKGTPYEGGLWRVRVTLTEDYPAISPRVVFMNRIYHPNVDDLSGEATAIIRELWSPMHDLSIVFQDTFPSLLKYPNVGLAVNNEALDLYRRDSTEYASIVKDYVNKHSAHLPPPLPKSAFVFHHVDTEEIGVAI